MQIDSFAELPKEQRPPEKLVWDGTSSDIENWLDRVFKNKQDTSIANLEIDFVEG